MGYIAYVVVTDCEICKSGVSDFVHRISIKLRFGTWIFFRLQVKRSRSEDSSTRGPNSQDFCPFLLEDGRRSSFRNVVNFVEI
jgi:hypothetical protein